MQAGGFYGNAGSTLSYDGPPPGAGAAGGIVIPTKAGVPVNGDFFAPVDGMVAVDTTDDLFYFRSGAAWFSTAPAPYTGTYYDLSGTTFAAGGTILKAFSDGGGIQLLSVTATESHLLFGDGINIIDFLFRGDVHASVATGTGKVIGDSYVVSNFGTTYAAGGVILQAFDTNLNVLFGQAAGQLVLDPDGSFTGVSTPHPIFVQSGVLSTAGGGDLLNAWADVAGGLPIISTDANRFINLDPGSNFIGVLLAQGTLWGHGTVAAHYNAFLFGAAPAPPVGTVLDGYVQLESASFLVNVGGTNALNALSTGVLTSTNNTLDDGATGAATFLGLVTADKGILIGAGFDLQVGADATGATTSTLGANNPSASLTPDHWLEFKTSGGVAVYVPGFNK
jgi:hypothetical protein